MIFIIELRNLFYHRLPNRMNSNLFFLFSVNLGTIGAASIFRFILVQFSFTYPPYKSAAIPMHLECVNQFHSIVMPLQLTHESRLHIVYHFPFNVVQWATIRPCCVFEGSFG